VLLAYKCLCLSSVADTHHIVADADADPDPSFQVKAQNLEKVLMACRLIFHTFWLVVCKLMRMRIQLIIFDPDPGPYPAYHFDADPDSNFQFNADPDPQHHVQQFKRLVFRP
jgi:hypothetical protein